MIKQLKYFFFVILIVNSCHSISQVDVQEGNELFAKIYKERVEIIQDTLLLKQKLSENINFDKPINFDKVEVIKQKTIGEIQQEYYFVLLKDSRNNIKIARWLNLTGDELYFNNKVNNGDAFEQTYLICVGNNNCYPEVFIFDNKKEWGCSKDPKCISDLEKKDISDCDVYKTILISELKD